MVAISLFVERMPPASLALPLRLRVSLDGHEFEAAVDSALGSEYINVRAPRDGTLPVRLELLDAAGGSLASFEYEQSFRTGGTNWVSADVATRPPLGVCLGAPDRIPHTRVTDSLSMYVEYGYMPNGEVC